ncbi:hypothetical protein K505DRAFT_358193 [Melanomma pulvis-pyrius CBS 109.77]|uniref:Uncharacterized protein n=1 Tax=Melanomma pulvis-pyrius CBS 109.77 TaxID=1314802 RepID=A0A6A6XMU0_9PLEO|nr:hypothetical protein K505DRAFT_358193 [Melanomma pulvis-pyrius CBS 109.77]
MLVFRFPSTPKSSYVIGAQAAQADFILRTSSLSTEKCGLLHLEALSEHLILSPLSKLIGPDHQLDQQTWTSNARPAFPTNRNCLPSRAVLEGARPQPEVWNEEFSSRLCSQMETVSVHGNPRSTGCIT